MAPPTTAEDSLNFALACLNLSLSSNGKIDYDAVANAFGMSKNTAYQRLWALKKKAPFAKSATNDSSAPSSKKRGRPQGQSPKSKKRKAADGGVSATGDDDESGFGDDPEDEPENKAMDLQTKSESKKFIKVEDKEESE